MIPETKSDSGDHKHTNPESINQTLTTCIEKVKIHNAHKKATKVNQKPTTSQSDIK